MAVRLTDAELNKIIGESAEGDQCINGLVMNIDRFIALEAQRKLFRELITHSFQYRNRNGVCGQCVPREIWDSIKKELEIK